MRERDEQLIMEQWRKVALRVDSVVPTDGQAVVSIRIYVNHGCPTLWTEPQVMMIEPKASEVIAALGT